LRDGRFRLQFNWKHPAVRRIIVLYTPILVVLLVNQVAIWISYNLAILTGDNSVTYMAYATTLYQFPLGLVVTALSLATLPMLSQIASAYHLARHSDENGAADKVREFKGTLAGGLRMVITLILPATAGLFALAIPIVTLLFEHGQFTGQDTQITAPVLRIYLFGLPFAAVDQMLVYASYARKDTWRPALAGIISVIISTITAVLLLKPLGLYSLMIADATKHMVHVLIMLRFLGRGIGGLKGYHIGRTIVKALGAAVLTGIVAYGAATVAQSFSGNGFAGRLFVVVTGGGLGLVTFLIMVMLLDIPEVKSFYRLVRERVTR
jgi:putative peptidoglycan lipid II flippase